MFADFCAEIGVETIREYEQEYLKQQTELDKKQYDQHISEKTPETRAISRGQTGLMILLCLCRLEFESHRTRLKAQLEYEQKQLDQQKIKLSKMEETTKKTETMMAEHKEVFVFLGYSTILCC